MTTVALVNPNTDDAITARMMAVARAAAPPGLDLVGLTVERGVPLITDDAQLATAREAVIGLVPRLGDYQGIIVAAFGDPGCEDVRAACRGPVVGIGESALREAAIGGRRFAVATTTPKLVGSIERAVARLGLSAGFAGVALTQGDAATVTGAPALLLRELGRVLDRLSTSNEIDAVVIGGGPLADAARRLAVERSTVLVEPVPAAVRAIAALLRSTFPGSEVGSS